MKKELCVKLVIYKDCTEMHGQENVKQPLTLNLIEPTTVGARINP